MDQVLMFIVGITFTAGGGYIAKASLDAKNMIESALFGLLGVSVGLYLIIVSITGAPAP